MLRITATTAGDTLALEGRLSGPWVAELARCWRDLTATRAPTTIAVQLDGVTFVDQAGKDLLRTMRGAGTTLRASSCMMRAIVEELPE